MLLYLTSLLILLLLSAFFSGSETALFSLNHLQIEEISTKNPSCASLISKLLKKPHRLLISILIGNNLVNITASIIGSNLMIYLFGHKAIILFWTILIMAFLLLLFGEITPKMYAIRHSIPFAIIIAKPLSLFIKLMYPLQLFFNLFSSTLSLEHIENFEQKKISISEDEFVTLLKVTENEGIIEKKEGEIIRNIVEMSDTTAAEVMTPRTELLAIDITMPQEEAIQLAKKSKHRRLPVYQDSIDNIIGTIKAKKLLLSPKTTLQEIMEPVLFVPEEKQISTLLKEFKEKRKNLAIVVDEYGGTSGIVTLEDLIEEIVGEIFDEYDEKEQLLTKLDENTYRIRAKMKVEEINEELNLNVPQDLGDTLNGFLSNKAGKVPRKKETILYDNLSFFINKALSTKVTEVILTIKNIKEEN